MFILFIVYSSSRYSSLYLSAWHLVWHLLGSQRYWLNEEVFSQWSKRRKGNGAQILESERLSEYNHIQVL